MIESATLQQLIASSRLEPFKAAILAELKRQFKGVGIVGHPGKLDINDLLAKAIVPAPGIALGWSRLRTPRDVAGTFQLPIEWVAYVVTEDFSDQKATPPRRVDREIVALAIGARLLEILNDADTPFWGLNALTDPWPDPAPEMRPVLTMKTAEQGTAVYMVTWTQALVLQGHSPFDGATPRAVALPDNSGVDFDLDEPLPPQIAALLGTEEDAA